jgi:hypothetical protein
VQPPPPFANGSESRFVCTLWSAIAGGATESYAFSRFSRSDEHDYLCSVSSEELESDAEDVDPLSNRERLVTRSCPCRAASGRARV